MADSRQASDVSPRAAGALDSDRPILLVEDEPVNQRVIARILKKHHYRVDIASNGRHALERLGSGAYALVIMDCEMPILNGYEAARAIRVRENGGQRIPIVAVTAHALEDERERIIAAGMDDCVSKLELDTRLPERLAHWYPRDAGPDRERVSASQRPVLDPAWQRSPAAVRVFLKHVGGQWAAIEAAARGGDTEALRRASHKLKGSCLAVGLPRLAALCGELERNPELSASLLGKVERELTQVCAQLASPT